MRKLLTYIFLLLFCTLSWAQTPIATDFPYSCSFEDDEDLSAWSLNYLTGTQSLDQWIIGEGVHSEGKRSLYISSNGKSPRYGNQPNIVISYLRYRFPKAGSYDISFDWKCVGDSANAKMYLMICPEYKLTDYTDNSNPYRLDRIVSATSGIISPNVVQFCEQLGGTTSRFLCGSDQWLNTDLTNPFRVSQTASQLPFAIVFVWVNNNSDASVNQLGICVDNLQIGTGQIKKPQNVQVEPICEDSSLLVSWESGLNEFEVLYRKVGTGTWRRQDGITDDVDGFTRNAMQCSYVLQRISEGTYDVRVRGIAYNAETGEKIVSNFAYRNLVLVYCPENHCVNYIDLHSPNVLCTYGYHPNSESHTEDPYTFVGVLDYGPDSEESRHTVHIDPTELDSIADYELFKVPPGALASVRLGDYKNGGNAAAITYNITVDAENQGILLVKYAVVVENGYHTPSQEPFFRLEVLDQNGNLIDEICGHADYTFEDAEEADNMSGWHISKNKSTIAWKEWTTVGVNLQPYAGQDIKVRFTTSDCYQTAHLGYAYFTVDCVSARLETENCGNDAKIECYAPEGFAYAWYKDDPDTPGNMPISTNRELVVDPGLQEYTCRVSFIESPDCYFDVKTISAPRFPVPDYNVTPVYRDCSSSLKFKNTSHVMNKYDGEENHTKESTEDCHWYFTRLSDGLTTESYNWNPVYTCLPEGDTIVVTYTTYIGVDNACDSTRVDTFVVPNIIPGKTEFYMETCPETPVYFGEEWFRTDTTFVGVFPNFAGCDSTSILHLKVWPVVEDTYRHDSICSDGYVKIDGVKYNQPMENQLIRLKTPHGCDSLLFFSLTVNQRLEAEVDSLSYVCADDEEMFLTFDLIAGVFDSLVITFSTPDLRDTVIYDSSVSSIAIPYSVNILPGHYTATFSFYQFCCGIYTEERPFDIRYRSSIVEQKWNDVLTLLSPKYNGGYEFLSFQWYKNDEPLPGETHSYLYQDLDMSATYYVELMRTDSVVMRTCPMQPVHHEQQSDYPSIVKAGQQMPMYMEQPTTIWYYTVSSQYYSSYTLPQGYTTLSVPDQTGIYILKSVNSEGEIRAQIMIVE